MMEIINKIYIWFKKVVLNIMGVIRDMINKDNENKVEIVKAKCELAKYIMEKTFNGAKNVFGSRKNRAVLGIFTMTAGAGIGGGLLASAYIKLPDDEGESDDEN